MTEPAYGEMSTEMDGFVFISHSSADKRLAELVCRSLEENGIPCWIAPRDIASSDWAGSIMHGLRDSEVFVVILSENSIPSPEVLKEVTEATRICRYLIPFKVDGGVLNDRLQYHLGPCHWLDAAAPPIEARVEELIERIVNLSSEDAIYFNDRRLSLVDKMVWPHGLFAGRERELNAIREKLTANRLLFLHGMGGIGKTEIAKQYAKRYRDCYKTVIFAGCTTDLFDLLCGNDIEIRNLTRNEDEPQETWIGRKLEAFRRLAGEDTLLIIDDLDAAEDPYLRSIVDLPAHVLITARSDFSEYPTLEIEALSDVKLVRDIFLCHYGRPVPEDMLPDLDEILRFVNYHTITVELLAKQMRASFLKPRQMLLRLREKGLDAKLKETVRDGKTGERKTAFDIIQSLFVMSDLSADEKKMLCSMSFVPPRGIGIGLFGEILQLEDYETVNRLLSESWLIYDDDTDTLRMHPVIREVIRAQLRPTLPDCEDFVRGLQRETEGCWFFTVEERDRIYPAIAMLLQDFPSPTEELWEAYAHFVNVAWICGDFNRSVEAGKRVYAFAVSHFGNNDPKSGTAALYLAGACHNSGNERNAEEWYRTALSHFESCPSDHDAEIAQCSFKVGRCILSRGDIAAAEPFYEKAGAIYEKLLTEKAYPGGRRYPSYYGDYVMECERLEMAKGNYDAALELCRRSCAIYHDVFGEKSTNSACSLVDMGICRSMLGECAEAQKLLEAALEVNLLHNGRTSIQTVRTREAIADNSLRRGDVSSAKRQYAELEMDLETDFGEGNPRLAALRKKTESLTQLFCGSGNE